MSLGIVEGSPDSADAVAGFGSAAPHFYATFSNNHFVYGLFTILVMHGQPNLLQKQALQHRVEFLLVRAWRDLSNDIEFRFIHRGWPGEFEGS